jgi:hypothetical protein
MQRRNAARRCASAERNCARALTRLAAPPASAAQSTPSTALGLSRGTLRPGAQGVRHAALTRDSRGTHAAPTRHPRCAARSNASPSWRRTTAGGIADWPALRTQNTPQKGQAGRQALARRRWLTNQSWRAAAAAAATPRANRVPVSTREYPCVPVRTRRRRRLPRGPIEYP